MRNWGQTHLVNPSAGFACSDHVGLQQEQDKRYCYFMEPKNAGLLVVQEQFVRKVVRELAGLPNIIIEVMNEPHRGSQQSSAQFASRTIDWIINEGEGLPTPWRPLISVNASRKGVGSDDPDGFDVDWWAANQVATPHYEDVDIVSFHNLTGYDNKKEPAPCPNPASPTETFPRVDLGSIGSRFDSFRAKQTGKALLMSTDAVRVVSYSHKYGMNRMDLMEGQITTDLKRVGASTADMLKRSDLEDWAFWCFQVAQQMMSVIHFQQHSTFEAIYARINAAFRASLGGVE
jgi:hypothetical protein